MNTLYKDFQEKQQFFVSQTNNAYCGMEKVDSWEQLVTISQQFQNKGNFIFRGMKEAEYKILSQLQVQWHKLNCGLNPTGYHGYVKHCIDQLRNSQRFSNYMLQNNINGNDADFIALSVLQHYGQPTPLIDFTESFDVALFFMTEGILLSDEVSNEIKQYASLYAINRDHPFWVSYNKMLCNAIENGDEMLDEWKKENPDCTNITRAPINTYDGLCENGTGLIIERGLTQYSSKYFGSTTVGSNSPRQNMQNGLFVLNTSVDQSLEEYMKNWYKGPLIKCYNVHKDLCGQIRNYLEKMGITKDNVYLRNVICSDVYNKMISESKIPSVENY